MPDLNAMKVLIIGAGPTSIGQTGECHEGALEACRALAAAGCRLITVDANPDTIFNHAPWSQHPMIDPLTPGSIARILEAEQPDALLTLFSGRDGLHLASQLYQNDVITKRGIHIWGPCRACLESIRDRDTLQSALAPIGLKTPSIFTVSGVEAAIEKAQQLGFPVVLRCDDAHLIPDGLLLYNQDELNRIGATLAGEPESKFSVEASLLEWQQVELEVIRDNAGQSRLIGSIEYLDTAGIHPGDAIGVCPPQSLPEALQADLFNHARAIADHLNIVGGTTLRFAYHPADQDLLVLAVHPRYTTASALVARISGIPVARISSLLAAGLTWEQLPSDISATLEPKTPSHIVGVKWPRWDFVNLKGALDRLGPRMQATGHSVGYGENFKTALQKAAHAAESNRGGIVAQADILTDHALESVLSQLSTPSSRRAVEIYAALRRGASVEDVVEHTHIGRWFIDQFKALADTQMQIEAHRNGTPPEALLQRALQEGFKADNISRLINLPAKQIETHLAGMNLIKTWKSLPGKGLSLRYSTWGATEQSPTPGSDPKIVIVGNGASAIGNGAECDHAIFLAAQTAAKLNYTPIIINSNLTSPTTGHSAPCTCYCEPLGVEEIADVIQAEKPAGILTQFAGTAAFELTEALSSMDYPLLGTPFESLRLQKDRTGFKERMRQLGIPQPLFAIAETNSDASEMANQIGYPVMVSEAGGTFTELVQDPQALDQYLAQQRVADDTPIRVEQLLEYAIEAQAEVLCDGQNALTVAVMEHIELAGVHAGDSAAVLPPYSIAPRHVETITEYCHKIAAALNIKGLINIRFGIYRDTVYLLEAGSNISRNLAIVSKAMELPVVALAVRLILGETLIDLGIGDLKPVRCAVRAPVFPFNVFSEVDPLLGPNMRATGQVMALDDTFGKAYFKALEATDTPLPTQGTVLITVTDEDKASILEPARIFSELGFRIMATKGTHKALADQGIESMLVRKLGFGRPNLVDEIKNGKVQMVINTPTGGQGQIDDSIIRKTAITYRVANMTTPASALAAAKGIAARRKDG